MEKRSLKGLRNLVGVMLVGFVLSAASLAEAGGVKYEKDGKWVEIGGRIQMQYHLVDPDEGEEVDELFFRRLRPYISGSVHPDWMGKFQVDFGKAEDGNEVSIKDAYLAYRGMDMMTIKVGNSHTPFSREALTSSKKQQLIERTFVGDHNYGTPDRNLGVHVVGGFLEKKFTWGFSGAQASIDPDTDKLDFDTPVNANGDFNQGWLVAGRIDYHPFGYLKLEQGDFKKEPRATIGIAAFTWNNDDDNNMYIDVATGLTNNPGDDQQDVDSVTGFEVSGAIRGYGISLDAQYNLFNTELVDDTLTSGIYEDGESDLQNFAIEGGYMLPGNRFEIVAGYQVQDADGYDENWTRISMGANYFFTGNHDIKLQTAYRINENIDGEDGNDADEIFAQVQYVF